ncbi:DotH/IcmK family type IV secretion protein [Marinobacter sp. MBR-105]
MRHQLFMLALWLPVIAFVPAATANDASAADRDAVTVREPTVIDLRELPSDLDALFPITPKERVLIRERQLRDQNATYQPLREVTPIRNMDRMSKQAEIIPEIYVTPDYPTSVVFTDLMGNPWPIQFIGQTGSLADVEQPEGSVSSFVLHAKNGAGKKSLAVYLKDMLIPVTITVVGQNDKYHALKHIRIEERGPISKQENATATSNLSRQVASSVETASGISLDDVINKLAYKVTPEGFAKIKVNDPAVDAWIDRQDPETMYVMTDYTIVSPAPINGGRSVMALQDGVRVYVIPRINPVMALDKSGQRIYLAFQE